MGKYPVGALVAAQAECPAQNHEQEPERNQRQDQEEAPQDDRPGSSGVIFIFACQECHRGTGKQVTNAHRIADIDRIHVAEAHPLLSRVRLALMVKGVEDTSRLPWSRISRADGPGRLDPIATDLGSVSLCDYPCPNQPDCIDNYGTHD